MQSKFLISKENYSNLSLCHPCPKGSDEIAGIKKFLATSRLKNPISLV